MSSICDGEQAARTCFSIASQGYHTQPNNNSPSMTPLGTIPRQGPSRPSSRQSGSVLDAVTLQELNLFDEPTVKSKEPLEVTAAEETTAIACVLRKLPFSKCAFLDDEQTPVRRSGRKQQPSVRLRDSNYPNIHRIKPWRGEENNIPRRWKPVPVNAPPRDP